MLGEGFGQPVGERFDHDFRIIVMSLGEAPGGGLLANACRYCETSDIIGQAALLWRNEIGECRARTARVPRDLLAQRVKRRDWNLALLAGKNRNIVIA